MEYVDFASKISFYEFLQTEFKKPHFNTTKYKKEISFLKNKITIEYLTEIFGTCPKIIDIFEELFQLKRFTNAQYINFCFDVNVLNNCTQELIMKYIRNRIFKFENGKENKDFVGIYNKLGTRTTKDEKQVIFNVKRAITYYIIECMSKRDVLYSHLQNSIDSRLRISKYLIENLSADTYLSSINLESFLKIKRHPIDTKGLHGNFGIMKIKSILEDAGFIDVDDKVPEKTQAMTKPLLDKDYQDRFCYLKERAIVGIDKRKDRKPKVFDFLLLFDRIPKALIETNFYTTSGTKIGINEGEYVDLLEDIEQFNKANRTKLKFIWITDGNYWLTKNAEKRFRNLKKNYFKNKHGLLNYNLFKENLNEIKEDMKSE